MTASTLSTLQDFPWQDSLWAVKASADFQSYEEFHQYLQDNLPHNSPETRARYTQLITRRYFPGQSVNNLLAQIWRSYQDEGILSDLMRVATLETEPAIAQFVVDKLLPETPGVVLDSQMPRTFIEETFGEFKKNSYERLLLTVRHLGFVGRYGKDLVIEQIPTPADALLILLHDRLAPTPRIVRVSEVLEAGWSHYLGLRSPNTVRSILRDAESAGLLARYVIVDELEQVTTRYSRDEYIGKARRL